MAARAPVRYAVVGLGHIAQVAVLPAFAHARRNSKLVAVVSDDRTKTREITRRYRLDHAFAYEQFDECLERGRRGLHRAAEFDARRIHRAGRTSGRARAVREADGGDRAGVSADDRRVPGTLA